MPQRSKVFSSVRCDREGGVSPLSYAANFSPAVALLPSVSASVFAASNKSCPAVFLAKTRICGLTEGMALNVKLC